MGKPKAVVNQTACLACGGCISVCPQDAIDMIASKAVVRAAQCIGCGICIKTCPIGAIHEEAKAS